jgi:3-oxoacyl-[acyl-carrier protein] reductase
MSKLSAYIKRGIKYVLKESKQPIVKVNINTCNQNESLKGKKYLITGGGSGLGLAIAKALAKCGAKVVITGRNKDKLDAAAKTIGKQCAVKVCDIRNIEEIKDIIEWCFEKYEHLDGLINNAGISLHEWDFLKVSYDGFNQQIETNLRGSYFMAQEYIKKLTANQKHKDGNILFISSESGTMCDDLPYGLSKRAIDSLTEALSYKYYKMGIRVNAIAPGVTATEMTGKSPDSDLYSDNISGRVFIPEEVAETAVFLLSDNSKCISGQIIHTNGGNHIKRRY